MHHSFYKFSEQRDPRHAFVFIIPESDRWYIVDQGKFLIDEECITPDIYNTRRKDYKCQDEEKTCINIKKWLYSKDLIFSIEGGSINLFPKNTIQRGDLIQLDWIEYRNDGSYFWDGENVVLLNYDLDDYGSTPLEFDFPEFSFKYFEKVMVHNYIVNLSNSITNEVSRNITFGSLNDSVWSKLLKTPLVNIKYFDKGFPYSFFEHNNEKYYILGVPDSVLNEKNIENSIDAFKNSCITYFENGINEGYITFEWEGLSDLFDSERLLYIVC